MHKKKHKNNNNSKNSAITTLINSSIVTLVLLLMLHFSLMALRQPQSHCRQIKRKMRRSRKKKYHKSMININWVIEYGKHRQMKLIEMIYPFYFTKYACEEYSL